MSSFKRFNLICEEIEDKLILEGIFDFFKKDWPLEDELKTVLPIIKKKIILAFSNFYESGIPGTLPLDVEPSLELIDEGSSTPGFKVTWELNESYIKDDVLPCLLETKKFKALNAKYKFTDIDPELILRINAERIRRYGFG